MRTFFFWGHLAMGLVAALFIFVMSITGVILSYEGEITAWARNAAIPATAGLEPMDLDALEEEAARLGASAGQTLTVSSDPHDAVHLVKSRRDQAWLNPYDGSKLADPSVSAFFGWTEGVHRWFAMMGDRTDAGAAIMAAANLVFAVILMSGVLLWWPRRWKWSFVKRQMTFQRNLPTAQARNFNWHHVFGFWSLLPLLAMVLTAVVMHYSWASTALYSLFPTSAQAVDEAQTEHLSSEGTPLSLAALAQKAVEGNSGWNTLSLTLPSETDTTVQFVVDSGNGVAKYKQDIVTVSRDGRQVFHTAAAASDPRFIVRFLHTGQLFGWIGQTIAGLASLAGAFLVYTGTMLGIGRLRRMRIIGQR